jgi:hypothetical protein
MSSAKSEGGRRRALIVSFPLEEGNCKKGRTRRVDFLASLLFEQEPLELKKIEETRGREGAK